MINKNMVYTDLAIEAKEMVHEEKDIEIEGVAVNIDENSDKDIRTTTVDILNENGSTSMGKPVGKYVTIESEDIKESNIDKHKEISKVLADELSKMKNINKDSTILIVGLGNWNVTADSLGPRVIENIIVTRHIFMYVPDQLDQNVFGNVSAIIPGVMGITGMETSEIIQGVVEKTSPDLVIVIDALAARNVERVNTTIQLTDTGIFPGSGVGNKRKEISENILGVPVLAIGVPTVVNATTLISDIASSLFKNNANELELDENDYKAYMGLCVTPKEEDVIINRIQNIIKDGLNLYIHRGLEIEDIKDYIY